MAADASPTPLGAGPTGSHDHRRPDGESGDASRRPQQIPLGGLALLWLIAVDLPDRLEIEGHSGGAILTVITALVCGYTLLAKALAGSAEADETREPRLESPTRRVPIALIGFAVWATASGIAHTSVAGAQNVLVYDTFVGAVIACSAFTSVGSAGRYLPRMNAVAWVLVAVYAVSVARDGWGAGSIYGPRPLALAGVLVVAVAVSNRQRLLAVVTVLVIGSTVSRTATIVAIGILCLGLALNNRRRVVALSRIVLWSAAGIVAMALAVTKIGPLRDRFFGGDNAFQYHGISYNTSGRSELWSYTWNLAHQHLLFGGGPGDAQIHVTEHFDVVAHPHNDYLRLLNDLGVFGLALFLLGLFALLRATWVRGRRTGEPIHWAAFLALLGVACAAITDNALVYPFVMVPLGVVVGLSLAHPAPQVHPEVREEVSPAAAPRDETARGRAGSWPR